MGNLHIAFKSDMGMDSVEKGDSFLCKDNLFIVAEGLGGEHLGDIAKERACEVICTSFFRHLSEVYSPDKALIYALNEANEEIIKEGKKIRHKMAASVSVVYIVDSIMYFTHLGDSRIYTLRREELTQLTRDHTILEEEPYVESRLHDPRLMRALTEGLGIHEEPDVRVKKFALNQKDLILMTTEGLTKRVSNREILRLSLKIKKLEKLCSSLIDAARKRGEESNITVGIVRYEKFLTGQLKKILTFYAPVLLIISVLGGSLLKYSLKGTQDYQSEDIKAVREGSVKQGKSAPKPQAEISRPAKKSAARQSTEQQSMATLDDEIYTFIDKWKTAWENTAGEKGDIESYISYYSDDFISKGLDKKTWRHDKAVKGRKKRWIHVKLKDIRINKSRSDNRIEVGFSQNYRSSNYSVRSHKILLLKKEKTGWKIITEKTY